MIKAVIFDCFGVIIADVLQLLCDELAERDPAACAEVKDVIKAANKGMIEPHEARMRISGLLGLTLDEYRQRVVHGVARDEQLLGYIAGLRKQYKTAMLSNIGKDGLLLRFSEADQRQYFDAVVASGDIGYAKPEPEAYLLTAERLGVGPAECVFTDDRDSFCDAARATGMQAIHYRSFGQFRSELEKLIA